MNFAIPGIIALLAYVLALIGLIAKLWRQEPIDRGWVLAAGIVAAGCHGLVLALAGAEGSALNLSFFHALSAVAWVVVMLMLIGSTLRPFDNLGVVLYPLASTTLGLQLLFGSEHQFLVNYSWRMHVHVAVAALAYAILSLAAAQAILLAIQERALRRHQLRGPLTALPPLANMETMLFQLIALGFALLSLTLVSGIVFIDNLMAQHLVHKTVLSILAWLVFGLLLWGRWRYGWRGRTAIRMTLAGVVVLLLAYFGSKLVLELILHRVE